MRMRIGRSTFLVLCVGGVFAARADEPGGAPVQTTPPPVVRAALPQPDSAPYPYPAATTAAPSGRPDVRAEHLRQAAEHLRAAGLDSLADHVRALSGVPWPSNGARLWPAHQQAAQQQVLFPIKLIEVDAERLMKLGLDFSQVRPEGVVQGNLASGARSTMRVVSATHLAIVDALCKEKLARVLSQLTLVTTIGRPASMNVGGEIPRWTLGPDGQPVERPERIGTSVDVVPHLAPSGNLRIDLRYEYSEVDRTETVVVAGKQNPGIKRIGFDTGWETKPGQTLVVARDWPQGSADANGPRGPVTLLLVTPQLVAPTAARPLSYN